MPESASSSTSTRPADGGPVPRQAVAGPAEDTVEPFEQADWPALRTALTTSILASATPDRDDRLFPGDIEQFVVGGLGLAYGAAGVLYALSVTGAGRFPAYEDWLLRHVERPPSNTRPGLFDGLHGTAFVLHHLGHDEAAAKALELCLHGDWESLGLDLAGGLSGIGLNLAHFAERTGDAALRAAADRTAALVAERLDRTLVDDEHGLDAAKEPLISGGEHPSAGLLKGMAGPALFLLRAYGRTGDSAYLDLAARALRHDLRRCVLRDNGALEVNEGWRTMPYLDVGSVGIGMVLDEYLAHRPDEEFARASAQVERAAQAEMYILPGLFSGRAGILLYLAAKGRTAVDRGDPSERQDPSIRRRDPSVRRQIRGLGWHALPYGGGLAFPGTALLRLSTDLATGTAGVLLALGAALHDRPVHLPLLAPSQRPLTSRTPAYPCAGA